MYYIYIIYTLLFCLFILYLYKIGTLTDDSYLVSVDVRSLYSNIIHIEGIEAVTKSLQKSKHFYISISIITFLKLLLTLNSLIFNGVNYLQKKDCARRIKYVPIYANLFIGWFDEHFIPP